MGEGPTLDVPVRWVLCALATHGSDHDMPALEIQGTVSRPSLDIPLVEVYTALQQLLDLGLVEKGERVLLGGRRRLGYRLTDAGRRRASRDCGSGGKHVRSPQLNPTPV